MGGRPIPDTTNGIAIGLPIRPGVVPGGSIYGIHGVFGYLNTHQDKDPPGHGCPGVRLPYRQQVSYSAPGQEVLGTHPLGSTILLR